MPREFKAWIIGHYGNFLIQNDKVLQDSQRETTAWATTTLSILVQSILQPNHVIDEITQHWLNLLKTPDSTLTKKDLTTLYNYANRESLVLTITAALVLNTIFYLQYF